MKRPDIDSGRLPAEEYRRNFADIKPALNDYQAHIEASRCLYCEAAPCIPACPTGINIPSFINRIATDNIDGAAQVILDANILGGSCARVCPTEILCEQACVRHHEPECRPVRIGRLQRYAVDNRQSRDHPFTRLPETGKTIAVVGAGPAGLTCAHHLAREGHNITLYDAQTQPGGLNEYGIASYKLVDNYARQEVEFIMEIGGIRPEYGCRLGQNLSLDQLRKQFDAVFLGLGLGGCHSLGLQGEAAQGVEDALPTISRLRQCNDLNQLPVGRRIVVIGGGNTAIDIACQYRRLGAEEVTIAYRRGREQMSATDHEQAFARDNGVRILTWVQPSALETEGGCITAIRLEKTTMDACGQLQGTGELITLPVDTLYKAIGQHLLVESFANTRESPEVNGNRIVTDDNLRTSLFNVWAGGDCIDKGKDLTVHAVEHGKRAAHAIHQYLRVIPAER
ncbi:NAD(P)-dependent oxidoreductase [Endozoicomonas sp. SCSIO W0465]|uniref:NAD(P)-dependent oxidoreductase n=1 Tax=Endozoicomonas sp. SCSIO W0465 TaxID=2918516 RepID=UPI002075FAF1|nr:NAD(P)-dependent oxidoreductase [Endozoicomonas sp. SCSIO W0465]USE37224.1 NAD(P)-dependent oxidoreductase [Endozoicomonas sp. SCSIO W0465]